MNKGMDLLKRIAGTLMLPVAMFIVMKIICDANGKTYFGTLAMWRTLIVDIAVSVTCAMGIGLQFKNGRFDFSGGAIMLVAAIVAGTVSRSSSSTLLFSVLCIVVCVVLSVIVALVYVYGRLPIMIATLGMALLYEAITPLIFGGGGINLVSVSFIKKLSTFPLVLIPFAGAVAVYAFYSYVTTTGKQSLLLARNQQAAVNIGISENKNVILSYVYSGIIFGFATMIWASTGKHDASYSSLSTVGELFSNILPVFVGLYIGVFCGDTIGIIVGSVTLSLLSYGLTAVFANNLGTAISNICMGAFILLINVVSAQGRNLLKTIGRVFGRSTRR